MHDSIERLRKELPHLEIDVGRETREAWRRDASGFEGAPCGAVVSPRNAQEVEQLLRSARKIGLPLVPVGSRAPHHRGDTLCVDGSLVVDMRHFDRVVRIDRRNRVALFEAGVTFESLTRELAREGLRPLLPLGVRRGKSALAAYLEREPTIYPRFQWDASDPLLCTEVFFGTGERFRTGSAAGPGTLEELWAAGDAQTNPMGPGQSDLMRVVQGAQGTIGIVTWCSARCVPIPEREHLFHVSGEHLTPLVEVAYGLLRRSHADILLFLDRNALAALEGKDRCDFLGRAGAGARWHLLFSVSEPRYFPEEKMRYVKREIAELLDANGLCIDEAAGNPALLARLTQPDRDDPYWRYAGKDGVRELFFVSTLDRVERFLPIVARAAGEAGIPPEGVLTYLQPLVGGRMCHVEFDFPFSLDDREEWRRLDAMLWALARDLKRAGAFFSRPYHRLSEIAFEGASSAWLVPKIKKLFDPDGLLSPGCLTLPAEDEGRRPEC
ncbi:MAG: FAD-binding oxidoreductase [Deltaproteobacteria bacterium]|nr:MAG: FAD-binding oxidoreductase [Deltaproteobacteria bacterium]